MMILIAAAICIMSQVSAQDSPTLSQALKDKGLTTLATNLPESLVADLEKLSKVTVFAPTNDAFTAAGDLPTGDDLVNLLKYHVVSDSIDSSKITEDLLVDSMNTPKKIRLNKYKNGDNPAVYTAQGAVIDTSSGMFDIAVANGYIHIVKSVLTPPTQNVYELTGADSYSKLKKAIDDAGLKATLEGTGPFTVFAPNNDAGGVSKLENSNKTALGEVLKYHVVAGAAYSAGLYNNQEFTTVQGDKIKIVIDGGKVFINNKDGAEVKTPDVSITNGVVHGINAVLDIPDGDTSGSATTVFSITALCAALLATLSVL